MRIQGIYKIINKINNKIYIGQSINLIERFKQHRRSLNKYFKYPLYNAFRKYGIENFEFSIIEEVINIRDLDAREQYWLDHYQSYLPEKGYNLSPTASSTKGYKSTLETREKMSLVRKGKPSGFKGKKHSKETKRKLSVFKKEHIVTKETRQKIAKSHKGKNHTEQTRNKIALTQTGKHHTEKTKEKISLYMTGKKRGKYKKIN